MKSYHDCGYGFLKDLFAGVSFRIPSSTEVSGPAFESLLFGINAGNPPMAVQADSLRS